MILLERLPEDPQMNSTLICSDSSKSLTSSVRRGSILAAAAMVTLAPEDSQEEIEREIRRTAVKTRNRCIRKNQ